MTGVGQPRGSLLDQSLNSLSKMKDHILVGMDTSSDICLEFIRNDLSDSEKVKLLKDAVLEYAQMEMEIQRSLTALHDLQTQLHSAEVAMETNWVEEFEKKRSVLRQNENGKLQNHPKYKELMAKIEAEMEDVGAAGALAEPTQLDEDVTLMAQDANTRCPYTQQEMKNPVTNKHCNHNYDRDGIMELIKTRGPRAKCPVAGCKNMKPIDVGDLVENKQLRKIILQKNKSEKPPSKRAKHE